MLSSRVRKSERAGFVTALVAMRFRSLVCAGIMLASICFAIPQARADLVTNGGFETGDFSGWTASVDPFWSGVDGNAPHSGSFGVFFGNPSSLDALSQSIATTAGVTYQISFWLKVELDVLGTGTPNSFSASFGGVSLFSLSDLPAQDYKLYTFNVIATANASELAFSAHNEPAFFDLDDVSVDVASVPGPIAGAGLPGLAMALGGVLAWRRRRNRPAVA